MTDRYQLVEIVTGRKLGIFLWDGVAPYAPPEGQRIEPDDGAPCVQSAASGIEAVDAERDRRLALGVAFAGHVYQTRPFDISNLTGAATAATAAMLQGAQAGDLRWADPATDFGWIDIANTLVPLDAPGMLGLAMAAMTRRAALIMAGRAIKDRLAAGEALTVTDDALWPA